MGKEVLEMRTWEHVVANGVATLKVPTDRKYAAHLIEVIHNGVAMSLADMKTHIEWIEVIAEGYRESGMGTHKIMDISGEKYIETQLENRDYPQTAGILPLIHSDNYWDNPGIEDALGLGTADIENLFIKIKLSGTVVNPALSGVHLAYDHDNEPIGQVRRLLELNIPGLQAGRNDIEDVYLDGLESGIQALHLYTDLVTEVEITERNRKIYDMTDTFIPYLNDLASFRTAGRVPVAGVTHLDFAGNRFENVKNTQLWKNVRTDVYLSGAVALLDYVVETIFSPMNAGKVLKA